MISQVEVRVPVTSTHDRFAVASCLSDIADGGRVAHIDNCDGAAKFVLHVDAADQEAATKIVAETIEDFSAQSVH